MYEDKIEFSLEKDILKSLRLPPLLVGETPVEQKKNWETKRQWYTQQMQDTIYGEVPEERGIVSVGKIESRSLPEGFGLSSGENIYLIVSVNGIDETVPMWLVLPDVSEPSPVVIIHGENNLDGLKDLCRILVPNGVAVAVYDRTSIRPNVDRKEGAMYRLFPEWDGGSLAAWSWGMMRCIDYLANRSDIDETKIAVAGHSQYGKATMITSVLDERVAMAIPLCSGCAGTALLNYYGYNCETLKDLTLRDRWHYWLKPKAHRYSRGREVLLPFDMHTIRAMMAPRLVLSIDGVADHWANPAGTKLGFIASQDIYTLYGIEDRNRAIFREGGHSLSAVDALLMRDFMTEHGFINRLL